MKLILCSKGIETKGVVEKAVELVGKPASEISAAFILEADAKSDDDKRWQIECMYNVANTFGGTIKIVNLLALDGIEEIEQRLRSCDIIYCLGGSPHYLRTVFDKVGLGARLLGILEEVVWIGNSAGSMILGKRCPYRESVSREKFDTYGVEKFYRIIDCHISPHINCDDDPKHALETAIEESKLHQSPVYALSDDGALVVDGDKTYMIGKDCWKIENGKIVDSI